jgi:hypothetical protein
MPVDDSESTTSISKRYVYTNDVLAGILLSSLPVIIILGATQTISLGSVPDTWALSYLVVEITAAVWTFGGGALQTVMDNLSK